MNYKISVIVATYNSGDFLNEFLDSIKSQSLGFEDIEVIFVDDASTDDYTLDLLNNFNESYPNVSVIFLDENSGFPGTGRNRGLDLAGGEYVIFADHDDSYVENAFEVMYNEISKENADFLITNYYKVYERETVKEKTVFDGENVVVNSFKDDLRLFDIGPSIWTKLFKKDLHFSNLKKQFIWMIFIAIIIVYVMLMETNQQYISEIKNTWKAWSMVILR